MSPGRAGLRILLLNWLDPLNPAAGGAERHLDELFGRLARRGFRITLVASGFAGARPVVRHRRMAIVRTGGKLTFAITAGWLVRRLLRRRRFDLLVEDLNKVPLHPVAGSSPPFVVLVHHLWGRVAFSAASWPVALLTWAGEHLIPFRYRRARFIAVSESTERDLVRLGVPSASVSVIRNAAGPPAGGGGAGRAPIPTFLYLGRLQRYKRVHLLVEAAAALAREGPHFEVWIAGAGPEESRLRRLVWRLGVASLVRFLGPVAEEDKPRLFGQAWANVLMSMKEGWGLTILEAAIEGTCSVVAFAPGLWDAVEHLETGLWVPYQHLPTLADALRYLIRNPDAAERLGAAARLRARSRTWCQAARELERALLRAVDGDR